MVGRDIPLYVGDVGDASVLERVFSENRIDAVIHFAGLKAVGESVAQPLRYYRNNLDSTLTLLEVMHAHGVSRLVFSSSATVYGLQQDVPYVEGMPLSSTNPYGWSKVFQEQILQDLVASDKELSCTSLRYFNPVGAHPSGLIGEDPNGIPNNLMPFVSQVAVGRLDHVNVYGDDYPTPDGTGVRDYIHVVDLAKAHLAALEHLDHPGEYRAYNIGTGNGTSVLELIGAFEDATGVQVPYVIADRRPGDVAACWADTSLAASDLGWKAELTITDACRDSWAWQSANPSGYKTVPLI